MPFSKETIEFLMENRVQNSRSWFHEHHAQYERFVQRPLKEFAAALTPAMLSIDPQFIVEPVGRTISRINRDTRFSHDKSLYREEMWCAFTRGKSETVHPPAMVFGFSPDGFYYGCGYYCVPIKQMDALREMILRDDLYFKKARKAYESQSLFTIEGECYKRLRHPEAPEEKQVWLNRKCIEFVRNETDFALLFSEGLAEVVTEGLLTLKPMYELLLKSTERMKKQ